MREGLLKHRYFIKLLSLTRARLVATFHNSKLASVPVLSDGVVVRVKLWKRVQPC
jgi:hypothetical protein